MKRVIAIIFLLTVCVQIQSCRKYAQLKKQVIVDLLDKIAYQKRKDNSWFHDNYIKPNMSELKSIIHLFFDASMKCRKGQECVHVPILFLCATHGFIYGSFAVTLGDEFVAGVYRDSFSKKHMSFSIHIDDANRALVKQIRNALMCKNYKHTEEFMTDGQTIFVVTLNTQKREADFFL